MLLTVDGLKFDGRTPVLNGHDSTRVGRAWPWKQNGHATASVFIRDNSNFVRFDDPAATHQEEENADFTRNGNLVTSVETEAGHAQLRDDLIQHLAAWSRRSSLSTASQVHTHTGWRFNAPGLLGFRAA